MIRTTGACSDSLGQKGLIDAASIFAVQTRRSTAKKAVRGQGRILTSMRRISDFLTDFANSNNSRKNLNHNTEQDILVK